MHPHKSSRAQVQAGKQTLHVLESNDAHTCTLRTHCHPTTDEQYCYNNMAGSMHVCPCACACAVQVEQCTVQVAQCTVQVAQCTVHVAQCTVHVAQCTVHVAQCTVHVAQCTVHVCVKHTSLPKNAHTEYTMTSLHVRYAISKYDGKHIHVR